MRQNSETSLSSEQSNKTNLRFNAEDHTYWLGARRIPGFTEIRTALGIGTSNAEYFTEDGRQQGTALHAWLLFLAQGKQTDRVPEPEIVGRVEGIKKFLRESKFVLFDGEKPLYDHEYDCCCTPDLWGRLDGRYVLIEAKRGAEEKWHRLQTVCQCSALSSNGFPAKDRYALYLRDNDYKLVLHNDTEDWELWEAIVNGYNAKRQFE